MARRYILEISLIHLAFIVILVMMIRLRRFARLVVNIFMSSSRWCLFDSIMPVTASHESDGTLLEFKSR